jgi:hypothetical protein
MHTLGARPVNPKFRSPDSRFGQNRESGNPRFPISSWPKIGKSGILVPCEYQTRSGGQMFPLILENADFRPPTHVSGGCHWLVASSVGQRPKSDESPIPVPPIPDLAGNRGGIPRFPIVSAKIGKRGFPVSRFGGNRETGNPRFPIGNGDSLFPDSAGIGKQGIPVSRFGRDRESGSRWRRAGDFLVCLGLS